jgi:hypothetical protein
MNTCKVYVCDINYDARSLYKFINNKFTSQSQAEHAEDHFNSLPNSLVLHFDAMSDWTTHKKVLSDWSFPYMVRDEIIRLTGWRIVSFDIAGIAINDKLITYTQDMTFEFKTKRPEYSNTNVDNEEEVINRNEEINQPFDDE